jgi:hypothetical protein
MTFEMALVLFGVALIVVGLGLLLGAREPRR